MHHVQLIPTVCTMAWSATIGASDASWEANFLSDQMRQVQLVILFVNQAMEKSSCHATTHLRSFIEMDSSQDHDNETIAMSQILNHCRYPGCEKNKLDASWQKYRNITITHSPFNHSRLLPPPILFRVISVVFGDAFHGHPSQMRRHQEEEKDQRSSQFRKAEPHQ